MLSCALTLSQMLTAIFNPREICDFNQGNSPFRLVTYLWRHIHYQRNKPSSVTETVIFNMKLLYSVCLLGVETSVDNSVPSKKLLTD